MSPFITALCPTYRRPQLLRNAIACYLSQDYPRDRCELVILDDAGEIAPQSGAGWRLISVRDRFDSLPAKYNEIARLANPNSELFVIFEDDDIYLPHHFHSHAMATRASAWSKPSSVLSTYTGTPQQEVAAGRFFASIGITKALWSNVGGVIETPRADFDQQFLALLERNAGPSADTLNWSPQRLPSYCFRWTTTGAYHGQAHMQAADDEEWYARCASAGTPAPCGLLEPELDDESKMLFEAAISLGS